MAKPSTKRLLKSIRSDDLERVYIDISNTAVEWAVAGFLREANHLLSELWKYNLSHSGHLWLPDEGLQVMWTVAGQQPSYIPFSLKDITAIEKENWSRAFYPCGDEYSREKILPKSFGDLNADEIFFKAINAGYDNSEKPADIIAALQSAIGRDALVGHSYFHAATCGALLAARNNFIAEAEYFIRMWGQGYFKYWANYSLAQLMRDRSTALLLLQGLLAPIFKLSSEVCQKEAKDILDALSIRMAKGRALVYGKLSWRKLLDKISHLAIKQKTIKFTADVLQANSLGHPAATKRDIVAVEKRLNVQLPEDYKAFLLASNGLECFTVTGVKLLPVQDVAFLRDIDEGLEMWVDSREDFDPTFKDKITNSILIGEYAEQQLLLVPLPESGYECWHFSSWNPGEVTYPGFRFYMEEELQQLEDGIYAD